MKQLKTRQICLFFIAFSPMIKLFYLPSLLAGVAYEDMWICAILNLLLDLTTLLPLLIVCQREEKDFITLIKENFGVSGAKILFVLYALYFFTKGFLPLQEQKEFIKISLYINLPTDLFFIPFFIASYYLCLKPLRVLGRVSDICWFFTLIGYLVLMCLTVNNVDFFAILPVGAQGVKKILKGSYYASTWWGDCVYLMFFIGNFKGGRKATKRIFLSYVFVGLLVVLALIFFWGTFTSIAPEQKFAMTQLSKYTTVINNTGRFDYFGILFILFSSVFSLALPLYFTSMLLNEVFSINRKWIIPLIVNLSMLILTISLNEYMASLTNFIQEYMSAIFLLMSNVLPVFTLLLNQRRRKYENAKA